jgi:hypothetical protein
MSSGRYGNQLLDLFSLYRLDFSGFFLLWLNQLKIFLTLWKHHQI